MKPKIFHDYKNDLQYILHLEKSLSKVSHYVGAKIASLFFIEYFRLSSHSILIYYESDTALC